MTNPSPRVALSRPDDTGFGRYMALSASLLGWMFDGAEMGVFSMVGRPALDDLLPSASEHEIGQWFGVITAFFLVGAATGGVLFGWLGDRIGRVRAMTWSVLVYAAFTGMGGLSQSALQLGVFRFIAALGMGGEWALGVALVMEAWPDRSRTLAAGLIGAAAPVGYLMVGLLGLVLTSALGGVASGLAVVGVPHEWVDWLVRNQGWRIMLLLGTVPAFLTFLIRLFVPESKSWQSEQDRGTTSLWAARDLVAVAIGALGPIGIIFLWAIPADLLPFNALFVRMVGTLLGLLLAVTGYIYPALRYLWRNAEAGEPSSARWQPTILRMLLASVLSGVALLGTWGSTQWAPAWADKLTDGQQQAKEWTHVWSSSGAIVGTLAAVFAAKWLKRRSTYRLMCALSMGSLLLFYQGNTYYGPMFLSTAFLMGACTATFYGWLPLYLPELFHTNIRATAMGFSFNFGRILAAVGALQVGSLFASKFSLLGRTVVGGYPFACSMTVVIYLVGMLVIRLAPETSGQSLPK